ncbi:MFS transporter [Bacillus massilinigeriensis]|uniref:MFS transporter n=1 Tax=Bacillus massilionigeriensis TaxID=1805475 RepID=UPI0009FEF948|nr:MFS transporter [Bacillus massilionigeriensis]
MKRIHYSWIILAVTFLGVLAAQGLRLSFGAFMSPWEDDFSVSRGTVSSISLVSYIIFAISQPIVGNMIDKFGVKKIFVTSMILLGACTISTYFATRIWHLFFLYGVISSLGFGGASGVTASLIVTKWFKKKQGFALGLVEAGFGAGQMVMVSSSLFLIEQFGWKHSVLYLGAFLLLFISPILLLFLKSTPADQGVKALGEEEMVDKNMDNKGHHMVQHSSRKRFFKERSFWFLIIPYFICGVTTTGLMDTHLVPFAQTCGFSVGVTGLTVSLLALFNTGGTVVSGFIADRWNNRLLISAIYFLRGISIVFLLLFTLNINGLSLLLEYPWLLYVFSISFGIVDFAVVAPTIKLLSSYYDGPSLGVITGFLFMSHQLGSALGSYLPGVLFDQSGSYTSSFFAAALLLGFASILSICLPKEKSINEASSTNIA